MEPKPYQISGCDVVFPRQPYGVQLAFMAKLIRAIDSGHNALLEAPTGCGTLLHRSVTEPVAHPVTTPRRSHARQQRFHIPYSNCRSPSVCHGVAARVPAGKTLAILCASLAWQQKMKRSQQSDDLSHSKSIHELSICHGSISRVFYGCMCVSCRCDVLNWQGCLSEERSLLVRQLQD